METPGPPKEERPQAGRLRLPAEMLGMLGMLGMLKVTVVIDSMVIPIVRHEPRSHPNHRGLYHRGRPIASHPNAARGIIAIHPAIPGARAGRPDDRHGRRNS